MAKICHRHCPDESGPLLAALAVILTAVLAVIIGQAIESLFVAIVVVASVLGAAGIALFVYLVHRDRPRPAELPARQYALTGRVVQTVASPGTQSISAPWRGAAALEAPRPVYGSGDEREPPEPTCWAGSARSGQQVSATPVRTSRTLRT